MWKRLFDKTVFTSADSGPEKPENPNIENETRQTRTRKIMKIPKPDKPEPEVETRGYPIQEKLMKMRTAPKTH